ncbi:MAG: hypothetical protein ACRDRP_23190 [Pseudonocardiaceae bacterium]
MSKRGPIVTLLAVAALAVMLVVLNVTTTSQTASQTATPPPAAPEVPEAAPEAPASASASPPPAAPQQAAPRQEATYAGRTSGNEATIAIAVRNGQAAAYVCDGRRVESWLQGTLEDGRLAVRGARDDEATGTVEGNAVFGTVSVNGKQLPYSARLASPPAGLYQGSATVDGVSNRIGWIVLPDGSQTGIRSSRNGIREPAPRIDPNALSSVIVEGTRIAPKRVDGITRVVAGPPS